VRLEAMQSVAACLKTLGFRAIEGAKYFQWERPFFDDRIQRSVKLDLLVGPIDHFRSELKTDKLPRVRPKGDLKLHARLTEEAIEIDSRSTEVAISGVCSDGNSHAAMVLVPTAFTYLMMKLFAFDDRKRSQESDLGRHHAMDLYRIVAMMNEPEYRQACQLTELYSRDKRVRRAQGIVATDFSTTSSLGVLRLKEHSLFREDLQVDAFVGVLKELFALP